MNNVAQQIRKASVSGKFYPSSEKELRLMVETMFQALENPEEQASPRAVIVPHAGYIFSGKVAASAYAHLKPDQNYKRIFYLGSSHYTSFDGASIYAGAKYETPLGTIDIDRPTVLQLLQSCDCFEFYEQAHQREHSIEVQLPFTQVRLRKHPPIVPIVIGTSRPIICERIAQALTPFFTEENLFVISTDLSHYPTYSNAVRYDSMMCKAVTHNNVDKFLKTRESIIANVIPNLSTPMCGWTAVLTLLYLTQNKDLNIRLINYKNSGDALPFGDQENVVGYGAFVITNS